MSRLGRRKRMLLALLSAVAVLVVAGCRSDTTSPGAPVATAPGKPADLEIRPILSEFLANLPPDWYLISARAVATAKPFILDVRQPEEFAKGFIEGAVNVPLRELASSLQELPATEMNTVLVCDTGHRSAIGMALLQLLGYKNSRSLEGGMQAWQQAKLAVVTAPAAPRRSSGQEPKVDTRLRAALDYYLKRTLPVEWGAMSAAGLTEDQNRKSSSEIEAMPETFDQGKSALVDVDEPAEFAIAKAKLGRAINLPLRRMPVELDTIPLEKEVHWA
jgi:rhodanese-related sulfurtransferase